MIPGFSTFLPRSGNSEKIIPRSEICGKIIPGSGILKLYRNWDIRKKNIPGSGISGELMILFRDPGISQIFTGNPGSGDPSPFPN